MGFRYNARMNPSATYRVSPDVLSQEVHGETVLLDLAGGTYFGLNEVGTRVWQLLRAGVSLAVLLDTLEGEFEVQRQVLEADINALLARMAEVGILEAA